MLLKTALTGAAIAASSLAGSAARADVVFRPGEVRFVPPSVGVNVYRPTYGNNYRYRWGYRPHWGYRQVVIAPPVTPPSYVYGGGYRVDNCHAFADQIRGEMNVVDADIRYHVQQGSVSAQALNELNAGRDEIERDLAEALQKGYVTDADRQHLQQHVQEMRDLRDRFRVAVAPAPPAYGYGYGYGDYR